MHYEIPYYPRPEFLPFHTHQKRWSALVCHRRAGKTVASVNQLIRAALQNAKPEPRYAYIAPLFVQAKDIAWSYLKRYTSVIPRTEYNEAELRVDLPNGARIRLYGADNYERLRGIYLDGVVLDEYGDMPSAAWAEVIRPALSDRQGWAVFIGTPKGRNHFWEIFDQAQKRDDWFSLTLKASETRLLPQEELDASREVMTPEQYEQEFECSFQAALIGAYYGKELTTAEVEKRICRVPYDPILRVFTSWDLGVHDNTVIWFAQQHSTEIRIIDYYENSGVGLDHYAKHLASKPYLYAEHFLPHDAKVREIGQLNARSRVETLESLGITASIIENQSIEDGINAVRLMLPRCWFDQDKCGKGIEALRQYQREYDDKLKTFKARPRHDWASHAADAFRYMALGIPETNQRKAPKIIKRNISWAGA